MASRKLNRRARSQRYTTNALAMFDQAQIREFKEAFNFMDQNRDSFIDHEDLREILSSFGKEVTDEHVDEMLRGVPNAKMNFTMFLTMFGEHLQGIDSSEVLRASFSCLDEENTGKISVIALRRFLTTTGDCYTEEQVSEFFRDAPISDGKFDYIEFIKLLKHGLKSETEETKSFESIPTIKEE